MPMPLLETARGRRILGRIAPDEFIGREPALEQLARLAQAVEEPRALLLLAAPSSGASELLRQAYDREFQKHADNGAPVYFAFSPGELSAAATAQQFLQNFIAQFIAFRRDDPELIQSSLSINDLIELSAPNDAAWLEQLASVCERERASGNERAFIRACLSAPQRAAAQGAPAFVLIDGLHLAENLNGGAAFSTELIESLARARSPFVLAGLRRKLLDIVNATRFGVDDAEILHLQRLDERDARVLIDSTARRHRIAINDQTRDLIAQQFACNPFYITALLQAAREDNVSLTSFLDCQQLYVDELMGGRLNRAFAGVLEAIAPQPATRRALVRTLYESIAHDKDGGTIAGKSPIEIWRKRLGLDAEELPRILSKLHVHELINLESNFVEVATEPTVWLDYLRTRYRMDIAADSRALVVAETLQQSLKRAPETMARHYRHEAALDLRELLANFDCQRVPASLLHYEDFARLYHGAEAAETESGLARESELIRLPQVVHVATCAAFHSAARIEWDGVRCAVAHGFDAGAYTDGSEIIWLAAEIDSKMEAGRGLTQVMCDRLTAFARGCGFTRVRLWLIAREGFTAEASALLDERAAYGSSLRQIELLTSRLGSEVAPVAAQPAAPDEFEMVIPMGDDTELIAAHTVEQIARRINFEPEAINQIKTALVEACINAAEHSLSPDRKIYQQFRVESDRLVVTVSSRGVVVAPTGADDRPSSPLKHNTHSNGHVEEQASERRGWGLKLIRTLMDEVEFERVDDGSRLRMTKYLHR
ncbi:MAG: ATP-binding protein [Pyrinomonadaceae bacterium]